MIDTPVQMGIAAQQTAAIHLHIPVASMRDEFPKAIAELFDALRQQSLTAAGPVFAHHFRRPTDSFDFNLCVPVEHPVQAVGRVEPVAMPSLPVLRTTYHGDYAGLPHAWGEFIASIPAEAPALRGDFIEAYVVGPHDGVSPAEWRTDLSVILTTDERQA
ncbi:GyrI-like domain-containing protein [Terriglobus sp.]|uniref:GyrI-like domain-containing protein n=1 Tax=Terriglobus sp. TaxID=1889013 RepID=UPI003AFFA7EE